MTPIASRLEPLRRLVRYGTPLAVLLICILSLLPGHERPHTGLAGQVEHLLAYALTAGGLAIGFPRRAGWIALGLAVVAGVLEVAQIWIPGRASRFVDFAASSGGALAGAVLADLVNVALAGLPMLRPRRARRRPLTANGS